MLDYDSAYNRFGKQLTGVIYYLEIVFVRKFSGPIISQREKSLCLHSVPSVYRQTRRMCPYVTQG
jgi:hypothetical protein